MRVLAGDALDIVAPLRSAMPIARVRRRAAVAPCEGESPGPLLHAPSLRALLLQWRTALLTVADPGASLDAVRRHLDALAVGAVFRLPPHGGGEAFHGDITEEVNPMMDSNDSTSTRTRSPLVLPGDSKRWANA